MIIQQHFADSVEALVKIDAKQLGTLALMAERICRAFRTGGKLMICGNGGSAADAQHIAAEFVVRYKRDRRAWPAIALTTDSSVITANANDFGFASVFERQVEALGKPGDILLAISTSGMSRNVLDAISMAQRKGIMVFAFTGEDMSRMSVIADLCFSAGRTTAVSQQLHMVAAHAICDQVEHELVKTETL